MLKIFALVNPRKANVVPVAPQQRKAKQRKILIFNENQDFLFSPKTQKVRFTTVFGSFSGTVSCADKPDRQHEKNHAACQA